MQSHFMDRVCAASGYAYLVVLFIGLVVAGFFPPLSPALTLESLAGIYVEQSTGILIGGFCFVFCSMLYVSFSSAIAAYMQRVGATPTMVFAQLTSSSVSGVTFLVCGVAFCVAGFRPDNFSQVSYLFNDFGWIMLLVPWPSFLLQNFLIGFVVLSEKGSEPLMPRWVAYLNFWVAIGFIPSTLLLFFKSGPFAWDGILVFWLAATVFSLWFLVMTPKLLSALKRSQ